MKNNEAKKAAIADLNSNDFDVLFPTVEVTIEGTPAERVELEPSKPSDKEAIANARAAKMRNALVQEKKDKQAAKPAKKTKAPKAKKEDAK